MFPQLLHRVYQTLIRSGRKPRSLRSTRAGQPPTAQLAVEGLEERALLSFVALTNGALVYAPATSVANSMSLSHSSATGRYTITDTAEVITLTGNLISPSGNLTHMVSFGDGNISSIRVSMFNQNFTVNIEQTVANVPVTVNLGNGTDTVNISPGAHNLTNIKGAVTIHSGFGTDSLNVNDQALSGGAFYTMSADTVTRGGSAPIHYGGMTFVTINGADGNNSYNISDTESTCTTTVNTGNGHNEVNVTSTGSASTLNINAGTGGVNANLGAGIGTLNNLHGTINCNGNNQGVDNLLLVDGGTVSSQTFTMTTNSITRTNSAWTVHYNALMDLVTIDAGMGTRVFNVQGTGAPTDIVCSFDTTVNVGNNGSLQQITRNLVISAGSASVNIDDSADGIFRTATFQTVTLHGESYGQIDGLTPPFATIAYNYAHTYSVTVGTGTAGATVNVKATGSPLTLIGHATGTVNVGNAGNLDQIASPLTITDPPIGAFVTLHADDGADPNPRTATLDTVTIGGSPYGRITGLTGKPSAVIEYKYADTNTVSIQTGPGGALVNALMTANPVSLTGSPAGGTVSLVASDADNTWNITGPDAGTLHSNAIAGTVTFSNVQNLTGGAGADSFVFADGAGVDGTIDGGGGANSLDYSAYSSSVLVDLQTGSATGASGGIADIQNVTGGSGGGAVGAYNLLIGNGGNVLTGGFGRRNILVAGGAASTLNAGDQEDLLIAGSTVYDGDPMLAAWSQIAGEWASSDEFGTRVNLLSTPGSGVPLLDASTVPGNGGGNTLNGTGACAWIFSDGQDTITNFDPNCPIVPING